VVHGTGTHRHTAQTVSETTVTGTHWYTTRIQQAEREIQLCTWPWLQYLTKKYLKKHNVRDWLRAGAYTRPLLSSTCAVSETRTHPKHPLILLEIPGHLLNTP